MTARRQTWHRFGWLGLLLLAAAGPRTTADLNDGWRFDKADPAGADAAAFDDATWQPVTLPHTWNNLDGQDGGSNYYRGPGWYRRHLPFDPAWAGRLLYVRVGAANTAAAVYVNGKPAGTHKGGFAAFCFDVTGLLHAGDNVVAVRVDNAKDKDVAPISADFTFCGGLYRGVQLLVTDPVSISPLDDGSHGVYVRQDAVSAESAKLTVTTVVRNATDRNQSAIVHCDVGGVTADATADVPAGASVPVEQHLTIPNPHLWDGRRDPFQYPVRVAVGDDVVTDRVGLRSYRVDPQTGFYLNGKHLHLHGVNRHQDRPDKGWAISADDEAVDAKNIIDLGCTAVRLSHYQQSASFYDRMDAAGIVVWAEIPLVNETTDSAPFAADCEQQVREMVKQNYNHPSICFWGLYNELNERQLDQQVALIKRLNDAAHKLDPVRLTTCASNHDAASPMADVTDVVAFNRYTGWYGGRLDGIGRTLDEVHAKRPGRAFGISEYGAGASIAQHEPFPIRQPMTSGPWHPEEYQAQIHERAWAAMVDRPYIWGTFVWCLHDFASDGRHEGDHMGINDKGLVTYDGKTRKDAFYFYQANWAEQPMVYVADRRFTPRPNADGPLKVYSNCDRVTVTLNGQELFAPTPNKVHVYWWPSVKLNKGENKIVATGTRDGKAVTDTVTIVAE